MANEKMIQIDSPVAHFLRLTPSTVGHEQRIVLVQLLAVVLASALFGTVLGVRHEDGSELHKTVLKFVHAHRFFGFNAVFNLKMLVDEQGGGLEKKTEM